MTKKCKFIFGIIAFVILSLIIVLCLYSYNNFDSASATLLDTDTSYNIYYPFATPSNTFIESNLIGFSNLNSNYHLSTSAITTPAGVSFRNGSNYVVGNTNYSSQLGYALYNYNNNDYLGFSLLPDNAINNYYNGSRETFITIPTTFMKINNTYTVSILLYNFSYSFSNNPLWIQIYRSNGSNSLIYSLGDDITTPVNFPTTYNIYFNYTCNYSDISYIRITTRASITGNIFINQGLNPVFIDNTQVLSIDNLNNGSYTYSSNSNNYNVYGNTSLFNYDYLYYSFGNKLSLFYYTYKDNLNNNYGSVADIDFIEGSTPYIRFTIVYNYNGSSTGYIDFYEDHWVVSGINSNINLSIKFTYYYSTLYDYNTMLDNAALVAYNNGYSSGINDGNIDGYNNGYSVGYNDGLSLAQNGTFLVLLTSVVEAPFNAFLKIFDFNILGYNMKAFLGALISISIALFVIRMILNGSTKNG